MAADRTPAIKEYFGGVMDLKQGLDKSQVKPIDPRALEFRTSLGNQHAEAIRSGDNVSFPLVGRNVRIAACFKEGSTFLLESDLRKGDGTPYKLSATLGPRTDFVKGVVEFSIGGKLGLDASRRRGIIISDRADPTKTSFSLEATLDTLAGAAQLSPVESTGLVHTNSGKVSANTRHTWGVILEAADPENQIVREITAKPISERVGIPDTWEEKGDQPRQLMANASVDPRNPNSPVRITNSNIIITSKDRLTPGRGEIWTLIFNKMFLNEAALLNGIIEPLMGEPGAAENLLEVAIINADANGKGSQLKEVRDRTMEALAK